MFITRFGDGYFKRVSNKNFNVKLSIDERHKNGDICFDFEIINKSKRDIGFAVMNTIIRGTDGEHIIHSFNEGETVTNEDSKLLIKSNKNTTFRDILKKTELKNSDNLNFVIIQLLGLDNMLYSVGFCKSYNFELALVEIDKVFNKSAYEESDEEDFSIFKIESNENIESVLLNSIERFPKMESKIGMEIENLSVNVKDDTITILGDLYIENTEEHEYMNLNVTCYNDKNILNVENDYINFEDFLGFKTFNILISDVNPYEIDRIRIYPSF